MQLLNQWRFRTEEVIRAHLQPMTMRQFDIALILTVDTVATLRRFQIHVGRLRILTDGFPEYLALIVRKVDAVYVVTRVFALQVWVEIRVQQPWVRQWRKLRHLLLAALLFLLFGHLVRLVLAAMFMFAALGITIANSHHSDAKYQQNI